MFYAYRVVNFNIVALILKNTWYPNNPVIKATLPKIIFYFDYLGLEAGLEHCLYIRMFSSYCDIG